MVRAFHCAGSLVKTKHRPGCHCAPDKPLRELIKFDVKPPPPPYCTAEECKVVHLPLPRGYDYKSFFVHGPCVHNVINAVLGRVAICTPEPTHQGCLRIRQELSKLARCFPTLTPITREQVVLSYRGPRRARYAKAKEKLDRGKHITARVSMFVKRENIPFKRSKPNPECRAIQFRDYTFGLEIARYIKPIEHHLLSLSGRGFPRSRYIAKGLTARQRGELLVKKYNELQDRTQKRVWVLGLDGERFDAHVHIKILDEIDRLYKKIYANDPLLSRLLRMRRKNKVRSYVTHPDGSKYVVKYEMFGRRMSGEMDTSLGNTLEMCAALNAFGIDVFGHGNYDFLDDGDDSVFFYVGDKVTEESVAQFFIKFGLTIKIEFHGGITDVEFCQARIVDVSGPTLVRDYQTVIPKTLTNLKFRDVFMRPKLLKTIATGELSQCLGVPVLDPFYRRLIYIADKYMSERGKKDGGLLKTFEDCSYTTYQAIKNSVVGSDIVPITEGARQSFAATFGLSIDGQEALESIIRKFDFNLLQEGIPGMTLDRRNWRFDWLRLECHH